MAVQAYPADAVQRTASRRPAARYVPGALLALAMAVALAAPLPRPLVAPAAFPVDHALPAETTATTPSNTAGIQAAYGRLPLAFEANHGQTDPSVDFLVRGPGYTLFLTGGDAVFALRTTTNPPTDTDTTTGAAVAPLSSKLKPFAGKPGDLTENVYDTTVLRMKLVGAKPKPTVVGLDALPGKVNYFIGNDPAQWRTHVPTYTRVQYQDVYPGIDLVYYGNPGQLEYDFVVAPGADPRAISLAFEGADAVVVGSAGDMALRVGNVELRQPKPVVYQERGGVRQLVTGSYIERDGGVVAFDVGAYDRSAPLVIDPVMSYSTYLGGGSGDQGNSIAADSAGNAYVTGSTASINFPTQNPFQTANTGSVAFVTKLNAAGSALVYSTYLGGSGGDQGNGIAVDSAGNAYVTGSTGSTNFPTQNPLQPLNGGGGDAFVTKLNATGSALMYSTYLGGSGGDQGNSIVLDSTGNAYVTGAAAGGFPTTPGAYQTASGGSGFVTKLNAAGSALVYSTYVDGSGMNGIAVDSAGNAYITGNHSGAFVMKLNAAGSAPMYSRLLGNGIGFSIAVDSAGNAYITGQAVIAGLEFPTTPGAYKACFSAPQHYTVFITKLNASGTAPIYSTCYGSQNPNPNNSGFGIEVDGSGVAYVTGGGDNVAFIARLNATGSALLYGTSLGGTGNDFGRGIAVDSVGNIYVTGSTNGGFPTTSGAYQTNFAGAGDAFVVKLTGTPELSISQTPSANPVVVGTNLTYTLTVTNGGESAATGVTVTDGLPASATFVSATPSQGTCTGTGTVTCTLGILASGGSATVSLVVRPTVLDTLTTTVTVSANEPDLVPANNTATTSVTVNDPIAPAISTFTINFGASITNSPNLNLSISATDNYSPASALTMSFSNDGTNYSSPVPYATTANWTLSPGDGLRTVYARIRDEAGNITPHTAQITLDTTGPAPTLFSINNGALATNLTSVTLNLSFTDNISVASALTMSFSNDGTTWSDWQPYATTAPWTLPAGDGSKTVSARVRDGVGNVSPVRTDDITLDTVAPTLTAFGINSGALNTTSTSVTLTDISATDDRSGVVEMSFSNDGTTFSPWGSLATTLAWTLTGGDGVKTVYGRVRDRAGNISAQRTVTIILDTTVEAQFSVLINNGALYTRSTAVRLSIGARPGTARMQISNQGSFLGVPIEPYASHKNWVISANPNDPRPFTRVIYVRWLDASNNVLDQQTDDIILDTTPPVGRIRIVGQSGSTVSIMLNAIDDISGVDTFQLSPSGDFSGSVPQVFTPDAANNMTASFALDSSGTVCGRFTDRAGNVSTPYGATIAALTVCATTARPGDSLAVAWSGIANPSATNWLGLYAENAADQNHIAEQNTTGLAADGMPFILPDTLAAGRYEFRLFTNKPSSGGTRLANSPAISVALNCTTRPTVSVNTVPASGGRLQVTVTANSAPGILANQLSELRFGMATNALIDLPGADQGSRGNTALRLAVGTTQSVFYVRQATPGLAATVNLVVVDGCGEWPTFAGGGPDAFAAAGASAAAAAATPTRTPTVVPTPTRR